MAEDKELTPEQIRNGHIKRFKQGVEVWNGWAEEMLREKEDLEKAGKWQVSLNFDSELQFPREVSSIPETQNWLNRAFINFSALHFVTEKKLQGEETEPSPTPDIKLISVATETIDFSNFKFPSLANFAKSTFTGTADFSEATFTSDAYFSEAAFTSDAHFREATFTSDAYFLEANFNGASDFCKTTFTKEAYYSQAKFTRSAYFRASTFTSDAHFSGTIFTSDAYFNAATFDGPADFSEVKFTALAYFREATYTDPAYFRKATFTGTADFSEASFTSDIDFSEANFTGLSDFRAATFTGSTYFREAIFTGPGYFDEAILTGPAHFSLADFKSLANFSNSRFQSAANFEAIKAERGFTLADATFRGAVPGFIQANFDEAPRLDNVAVPKSRVFEKGNRETEAKYRALKRLAIQAHDHGKELEFFAGEIRARRHASDRLINFPSGTLRYISGVLYDIFSDFGRSIWRPSILFAVIFFAFTQLYIQQATDLSDSNCANSEKMDASYAAYTIAAKNSLLFLGTDRTDKIKRAYTCLYGGAPIYEMPDATAGNNRIKPGFENVTRTRRHMAPNVPWAVSALGTLHSILSLILIFLLLLAIRNQFKIK